MELAQLIPVVFVLGMTVRFLWLAVRNPVPVRDQ